ncbi:MAG: thioredoxin [Deltaproteobacteria bacterium]|nr:thioredoxin [Deltaproteobacteria bacterium]
MTEEKFVDNPDHPLEITDSDIDQAITKYPFFVVDCWAQWCGPCRMLTPVVDSLAKKHQGNITFGKLDVDNNPATASKYGIRSIPNLIVFKDGQKVGDIIGAMPEDRLLDEINSYR